MDPMQSGAPSGMPQMPAGMPKLPVKLPKGAIIGIAAVVGLGAVGLVGKMIVNKAANVAVRGAIEAGTGVKVDDKGDVSKITTKDGTVEVKGGTEGSGKVTFTDKDGKTSQYEYSGSGDAGGTATLPKDFPGDFPTPPGATLTSSSSVTADGQHTFTLSWTTTASVSDTRAFFEKELAAKDWRITATSEVEGSVTIVFERGAADAQVKDTGYATIATQDGKTVVTLLLGLAVKQ
ncbi:MAG TPA: hypothetical protein VL426_02215 [Candidatus Binatia bacterium]|jgi:hypothetical protein|nr:hypothetical protein [Candidatus Binatia bacterium]